MQHDFPKLLILHPARKDKYEKKLLWYWLDTAYIGKMKNKEEEKLTRTSDLDEADMKNIKNIFGYEFIRYFYIKNRLP